jgi:anti-sigma B factor antagonist
VTSQTLPRDAGSHGSAEFDTEVVARDGVAVVVATGEIDLATSEPFKACLARAVGGDRPVVVDLCDVTFMGMAGLRAVLAARASLGRSGRPLALACRPGGAVARAIELSGSGRLLAPQPSRDAAMWTLVRA